MKKMMLLGLLFSFLSFAGQDSRTYKVSSKPKVNLANISGDIHVISGTDGRVEVSWTKDDDRIEVVAEQKGDRIDVHVEYPKNIKNTKGGVHFEVRCPDQSDLEVHSVSGSISVEGISGKLELQAVSGDISLADASGDLEVNTVSGNLKLSNIGTSELSAQVVSGSINYQGNLKGGGYSFNTTSGNILLDLDDSASFKISGNVMSGHVTSSLSDISIEKVQYTNSKQVEGTVNGGDVDVEFATISGNVTIK